ncbi:MAG: imidazolonepropionase-like domain-containing protein [Actinomycetota bacterium]
MGAEHERDILISGGRVFTSAPGGPPWAEALAIHGDRIAAAGSLEELLERFPDARRMDVEGRTVLPGVI